MPNLEDEISRVTSVGESLPQGMPILTAFGCVLLEKATTSGFVYTAANLTSGKCVVISRQKNPMSDRGLERMVERIRDSAVAGYGRYEADRPVREKINLAKAREIVAAVFRKILPRQGYAIREEQISLADHILETIATRNVALGEGETGTGKTDAYIIPAVIAKRGRLNDKRNMSLYPGMQYAEMSKMPIVIATSSIALQKAIITKYIPELSQILLDSGVIKTSLTAILRKGRDNYICRRNLLSRLNFENNPQTRRTLESLLTFGATNDLAEVEGLTPRIKREISVPGRCFDTCKHKEDCPYLAYRETAQSPDIDIQVCNHQYLLADTIRRENKQSPLIPNYQTLIIDEAHKFITAARSVYGVELRSQSAADALDAVRNTRFRREGFEKLARRTAKKLSDESAKLFRDLNASVKEETDEGDDRRTVEVGADIMRHLRNIRDISARLITVLRDELFFVKVLELLAWIRNRYGTEIDVQPLKKLLPPTANGSALSREEHSELINEQRVTLFKALCLLPEVQRSAELERLQRGKRHRSLNPERQLIAGEKSRAFDVIWNKTKQLFPIDGALGENSERLVRQIWRLLSVNEQAAKLTKTKELIYWLEDSEAGQSLCAIPNNINELLHRQQWSKGIATVLTSGTLSAGGDFTRTKQTLGLDRIGTRINETSKPSPFNYCDNALLYISKNVPYPSQRSERYITAITDETERLINAAHGHTVVLFTSYSVMNLVYVNLENRGLAFQMMKLERSTSTAIERFKKSGNGVLFASGALWEGIDLPGDALSMLIIVKLPFQVPDAISEYEKSMYSDNREYLDEVLVPDMLIKLKQGFGRLIRTETDTGVVAVLDCRANENGAYFKRVLNALPDCDITDSLEVIADFYRDKKDPDYFM